MRIYLLRHGIAADTSPDFKRELTAEGREKLAAVLKIARRAEVEPELVVSSPLVRALQTGEIAREILRVEAPIHQTRALVPDAGPHQIWDELREMRNLDSVLLAGHEPLLSSLVAFLLDAPSLQVRMSKAALVAIEMEHFRGSPSGTLRWMLTPKVC